MAIIKHRSSKNADYGRIQEYLEYEHDEKTGKVLRDENGERIPRENFLIDGVNCSPETFRFECEEVNEKYGKNKNRDEVKSHSYIISFDPRDQVDNGLTPEKVQEFGLEFVRNYLPGYQALVCTHEDGHHESGNLHCHIIINSIRIFNVERFPYMNRFSDNLEGVKHRATPELMRYLKQKVMEMCQERGLYQTDLLNPPRIRKSEKEYYTEWNGEKRFGQDYQTNKAYLRHLIEVCAEKADDLQEFQQMLQTEFHVTVKESRGRFSYLIPGRERGITERQLGTDYTKGFLEKVIRGEAEFLKKTKTEGYRSSDYISPSVKKLIDISTHPKASRNGGYAYKVRVTNLQTMAATLNYLAEKKIKGLSAVDSATERLMQRFEENTSDLKQIEKRLSEIQEVQELRNEITRLKPVISQLKSGMESATFRKNHNGDLILYHAAAEELKNRYSSIRSIPKKQLQEESLLLQQRKNALYEERSIMKKDLRDLQNAKENLQRILRREERELERKKERSK